MANKLSSTNIAELLEEHLKSINDINEVIVNSKIDAAKVKAISNFVKPLNESIASLNSIQQELSGFNGSSFVSNVKVKTGVKSIISTLKTVLEELNGFEVDNGKMKEFQKSFKPISEVLKTFGEVNKLLSGTDIGIKNKVKTKVAIKGLVDIIKTINDNIKGIEVDEEAAKKLKSVTEAITELSESVKSLMFVAITAPILVMLSPLINKSISVIVSIMQKLAEAGDTDAAAQAATSAATIGEALAQFAKGILVFVLATMGGVVILLAIVAILALKVFMMVFNKLFDAEQAAKTMVAMSVMQEMGKSMLVLSLTIVLWALTGILIMESMKEILVTILFVTLAIFVYALLGKMSKHIAVGNKTMLLVAGTLVILSMTVLLWALTGELIAEEWKNILITVAFVTLAILVFTLLGFLNRFIGEGSKSMLLVALTLIILSLTVLLWAEMGQTIMDNWLQVLVVSGFVIVMIGLMFLLALVNNFIKQGSKSLLLMAITLIILSLTVLLWAEMGQTVMDNWVQVLVVGAFVLICVGILFLLSLIQSNLTQGAASLLIMAVGLVLLSGAAALMVVVGNMILDNWVAMLIMLAFTVLMVGIFAVIGIPAVAAFVALGAAVLLLMGAALLVFSISALIMVGVAKLLKMEDITKLMALIAGLGAAVAAMGVLMPLIVLGSVAMGILGAALIIFMIPVLMFCAAVAIFKKMNAKEEDIKKPIEGLGIFINSLNDLFDVKMLIRLPLLAAEMLLLLPIVVAVGIMAKTLQDIASLAIPTGFDSEGKATGYNKMTPDDFMTAAMNACNIARIMANLFGDDEFEIEISGQKIKMTPISEKDLDKIKGRTKRKMNQLASIVASIGQMATVLCDVASLAIPTGFDEEGKATGYRQMTTEDFSLAASNVALIATTLIGAITAPEISDRIDNMRRSTIKKIKGILEAIGSLDSIVYVIQQMVQMSVPTEYDSEGKPTAFRVITAEEREIAIQNTITLMTELLKAMTSDDVTSALDNMSRKARKNLEAVMSSCAGVKDLVDSVKTAASFDQQTIANGISNVKEAILRYAGVINDLFVDKWGWGKKEITLFGRWKINIPWYQIVDKAEIDMGGLKRALNKMDELASTINPLKSLVDSISALGKSEEATVALKGIDVLKNIVVGYTQIFTGDDKGNGGVNISATGEKKFARFKELVEYHDYFSNIQTKDLTANTDQFVRFIDKANSIDTEKLKTVRDMFEQMAEFSKSVHGDFDRLADVLSEKLCDVLEKLQKTLDDVANMDFPSPAPNGGGDPKDPNSPSGGDKNKDKKLDKNFKDIKDSLEDMISLLTSVKNNTDSL
jgi:hypothetical protein